MECRPCIKQDADGVLVKISIKTSVDCRLIEGINQHLTADPLVQSCNRNPWQSRLFPGLVNKITFKNFLREIVMTSCIGNNYLICTSSY